MFLFETHFSLRSIIHVLLLLLLVKPKLYSPRSKNRNKRTRNKWVCQAPLRIRCLVCSVFCRLLFWVVMFSLFLVLPFFKVFDFSNFGSTLLGALSSCFFHEAPLFSPKTLNVPVWSHRAKGRQGQENLDSSPSVSVSLQKACAFQAVCRRRSQLDADVWLTSTSNWPGHHGHIAGRTKPANRGADMRHFLEPVCCQSTQPCTSPIFSKWSMQSKESNSTGNCTSHLAFPELIHLRRKYRNHSYRAPIQSVRCAVLPLLVHFPAFPSFFPSFFLPFFLPFSFLFPSFPPSSSVLFPSFLPFSFLFPSYFLPISFLPSFLPFSFLFSFLLLPISFLPSFLPSFLFPSYFLPSFLFPSYFLPSFLPSFLHFTSIHFTSLTFTYLHLPSFPSLPFPSLSFLLSLFNSHVNLFQP